MLESLQQDRNFMHVMRTIFQKHRTSKDAVRAATPVLQSLLTSGISHSSFLEEGLLVEILFTLDTHSLSPRTITPIVNCIRNLIACDGSLS